ncbi:GTP-binding protein HflX [Clostridium argentinense CDC 2741]|uniref:GTPase HflX n=1 Tax=Clostridium argentinense CDC 2741 TaxID=1418104 RepID=A0A0C1UAX0_9CLOT|nr:GTPase HflX [Clostridium argentinense]ARC86330.1 GTPase HflX [Clostridium argentinense]KIE44730.1 GTP-binding protein HflX [Clostridium argentinense CDC 2741]NFF40605.1 GTPase HflX [Clostridium argentinense]NFP51156.1 GTPase HflX [Clostridium argentinense]NFP73246.1 GTPase HflX [Clostridium argentinense]
MITGNINGIKKIILEKLEALYELAIDSHSIFSYELVEEINEISRTIKKEICVVINRRGKITAISVGKINNVEIPYINVADKKLSGFRVIHTHPNGESKLSSMDISALVNLKLDAIVAIGVKENIEDTNINIGFCDVYNNSLTFKELENLSLEDSLQLNFKDNIDYIDKIIGDVVQYENDVERAILVGTDSEESLEELSNLAKACNVIPIYKIFQKKNKVHSAYYAGQGKVQQIAHLRQLKNANVIIFDDELSGSQIRNLKEAIKCKVIDRTTLILDIFARRAKSKESILQVELTMLTHKLSRLRNANANLARIKGGVGVKGGVGSKGPGERKLETDKRHIESRIEEIKNELSKIINQRAIQKVKRSKNNISKVAIVGYTNAGKSTLRNKICKIAASNIINKKDVLEADMLFATLDTTVRAITLSDNRKTTLSDTVGFISKLPHELVEAFKSTLEEVIEADLLLHVVDGSNEEAIKQIKSVNMVLNELNAKDKNTIIVLNKIDKASDKNLKELKDFLKDEKIIEISAIEEINLNDLLHMIGKEIPIKLVEKDFIIPYSEQELVSMLHENSNIINEDYIEEGTRIKALVHEEIYKRCADFEVKTFIN